MIQFKEITNGYATFNPQADFEQIICPDGASTFLTVRHQIIIDTAIYRESN